MDWLARLYVKVGEDRFRIKVFDGAVGVERQPGGPNRTFSTQNNVLAAAVYDPENETWDLPALAKLLVEYQQDVLIGEVSDLDSWTETVESHPLPPNIAKFNR